jgi:hypothetical protein
MTIEECVENHLQSTIIPSEMPQVQYFSKKLNDSKLTGIVDPKNTFF